MGDVICDDSGEGRDVARRSGRGVLGRMEGVGPVVVRVIAVTFGRGLVVAVVDGVVWVWIGDIETPAMPRAANVVEHGEDKNRLCGGHSKLILAWKTPPALTTPAQRLASHLLYLGSRTSLLAMWVYILS